MKLKRTLPPGDLLWMISIGLDVALLIWVYTFQGLHTILAIVRLPSLLTGVQLNEPLAIRLRTKADRRQ